MIGNTDHAEASAPMLAENSARRSINVIAEEERTHVAAFLIPVCSLVVYLAGCAAVFRYLLATQPADWSWIDGVYFACVTMTTVGYGDYSPDLDNGVAMLATIGATASSRSLYLAVNPPGCSQW